jgi:subtilisin family serine protease
MTIAAKRVSIMDRVVARHASLPRPLMAHDRRHGRPPGRPIDSRSDCNAYPACWSKGPTGAPHGLISVVALNSKGTALLTDTDVSNNRPLSNYGLAFDVAAVGEVTSTFHGGWIGTASGSSVAAPYVTGLGALLFGKTESLGFRTQVQEIKNRILFTTDEIDSIGGLSRYGRINFDKALKFEDDWIRYMPSPQCVKDCWIKVRINRSKRASLKVTDGTSETGESVSASGLPITFKELKSLKRGDDGTFTIMYTSGDRLRRVTNATAVSDDQNIVQVMQPGNDNSIFKFQIDNILEYVSCSWYSYC